MNPSQSSLVSKLFLLLPFSAHRINYLKKSVLRDRSTILTWGSFAVFILFVYHFLSDGDFSFLLTLSSIVCSFGFLLVLYKIISTKSVEGLSLKSIVLYCFVSVSRLTAVLLSDAYLPYDKSGDWLYRCTEATTTTAVITLLILSIRKYKHTYYSFIDTFAGKTKSSWTVISVLLFSLLLYAEFVRPGLAQSHVVDLLWSFSHYVEAIAVYPQLVLFSRHRKGEIDSFTSHFVFSLAASRLLSLLFWSSCWRELNANTGVLGSWLAGRSILISQLCQIVLMANYIYYYVKSCLTGAPLVLPIYRSSREE